MDVEDLALKLCGVLQNGESGSLTHRLARMSVEEALKLPLREVLDAEKIGEALVVGLGGSGVGKRAANHLQAVVELERDRASATDERVLDGLPKGVIDGLNERIERPSGLPKGFGRNIVDPVFLRSLVASALTETLETFLTRLPFGGLKEGEGGLLGSLARRGAGRLKNAGSAISSLGAGMQDGVKRQAREFAQQSADRLKEGVLERLRAVESNQAVLSMRHRALACTLELSLEEFYGLADDPGWPVLLEWAEATLVHNLQREEVQEAIRMQVRSAFERLEEDTLGDWLSEYGTLEITVEQGTEAMAAIIGGLAATEDFEHWLGDLLSEALV